MEIRKTKCVDNEKPLMSIFAHYTLQLRMFLTLSTCK